MLCHVVQLVGRPGFQCTRDVSDAICSVLGVLRVPRAALGISASSKGAVAGEGGCGVRYVDVVCWAKSLNSLGSGPGLSTGAV